MEMKGNGAAMTARQKADLLRGDILRRNGEHFTSRAEGGRLGWETGIAGAAYSSAMVKPRDAADLHRMAYRHASEMIAAMNVPYKVRVSLTPSRSFTDSRTLCVATDVFDDVALTPGQKIDVFTGLAVHEGSHLLYTDFGLMPEAENRVVADLFNIIEDERIEMRTGEERPGLANFLACAKRYYFGRHTSRMSRVSSGRALPRTARLMNAIISLVRYPASLEGKDLDELADTLLEVRDALLPYPSTCGGALLAARRVYDVIRSFFESEGGRGKRKGGSGLQASADKELERAVSDVLDSIEEDVTRTPSDGSGEQEILPSRMSAEVKRDNARLGRALSGEMEMGGTARVNVYHPEGDSDMYAESLGRVRRFVPAMATALRCNGSDRSLELRGLRSGTLDTVKLAEAVQGVEGVYRRERIVRADRMAVCVLVDESGSMYGAKIDAARDTAVLLNEALSSVRNVDLYIYGHTTELGNFARLNVYREGRVMKYRHSVGSISACSGNIDSLAIREAALRVRRSTGERCLFFVISDGAPCEPASNVRKAVAELSRDGFSFVSIGIDFEYDPSTMYAHHVSMTDMSRLAAELGKTVRKAIMDNSKGTSR